MVAKHTTMGGNVNLYKRPNSDYWQCAAYVEGRNWRKSTKESDIRKAKDFAEGWYLDLRLGARRKYVIITQGHRNPLYVTGMMKRIKNYLIPLLGDRGLSEITPGLVQEYRIHRQTHSVARSIRLPEIILKRLITRDTRRTRNSYTTLFCLWRILDCVLTKFSALNIGTLPLWMILIAVKLF